MINNNDVLLYIVLIVALTRQRVADLIAILKKDAQEPLFGKHCQKVPIFYMEERFTWSITSGFPSG